MRQCKGTIASLTADSTYDRDPVYQAAAARQPGSPPEVIRYLERTMATLRQDEPDGLLAHLSPHGWKHVNLTGDYVWGMTTSMSENVDGLRPLQPMPKLYARAA